MPPGRSRAVRSRGTDAPARPGSGGRAGAPPAASGSSYRAWAPHRGQLPGRLVEPLHQCRADPPGPGDAAEVDVLRHVAGAVIVGVAAIAGHGAHEHGRDAGPPGGEAVAGCRKRRRHGERDAGARRRYQYRIQILAAASVGTQNALALAQDEVLPADLIEADDERPRRI